MSKRCRICGLHNPDSADRCDCGFDFATGTIQRSYLDAHIEQKHGGRVNLLRAASGNNLKHGLIIVILVIAFSVFAAFFKARVGLVPVLLFGWGLLLIVRGLHQRRELRAAVSEAPKSPAP
jgi:uncharacterized membrane protein YvbJ